MWTPVMRRSWAASLAIVANTSADAVPSATIAATRRSDASCSTSTASCSRRICSPLGRLASGATRVVAGDQVSYRMRGELRLGDDPDCRARRDEVDEVDLGERRDEDQLRPSVTPEGAREVEPA